MNSKAYQRCALVAAIVLAAASPGARAETFPVRPLTLVVPLAAGGAADGVARILAAGLSQTLGQPVIVDNIGGAGGMVGAARVAKAPPDGYELLLGSSGSQALSQTIYRKPLYRAVTDFTPVTLVTEQPIVLVARKDLPADNLAEFVRYARTNQARMQFGSAGAGSGVHLACLLLNGAIGVEVAHIPYRGGALAMQDLIAGRIDYQCAVNTAALPQLESRTIKSIAVLVARTIAQPARDRYRAGAGIRGRCRHLVRAVPAQGHARRDRAHDARGRNRGLGHAADTSSAAGNRRRSGRAGAPLVGLPAALRRKRDREVGRAGQGRRARERVSYAALSFICSSATRPSRP